MDQPLEETPTIYACATGDGAAALAVYRVSGDGADRILSAMSDADLPEYRRAALRRLRDPMSGERIDEALVLRFRVGASYTGDPTFEAHLHGGPAVRRAFERAVEGLGARLAQPGEFTRRALVNGRLDLSQAEAIGSLVAAESDAERRGALEVMDGAVGRMAAGLRTELISIAALLETGIDFVEEELGDDIQDEAHRRAEAVSGALAAELDAARPVSPDTRHPTIALIGRPNAGKSSLLNAIMEQDAAIVSDIAGTTRDAVQGLLMRGGAQLRVFDTAGVRETEDRLEAIGVDKAQRLAERADLRILVISGDTGAPGDELLKSLTPTDAIFWSKADLAPPTGEMLDQLREIAETHTVSVTDGTAAAAFDTVIGRRELTNRSSGSPISGAERRAALIRAAHQHLQRASDNLTGQRAERAAEDIKLAAAELERLIGSVDHEDVLDALFSRFCVGK